MPKTNWLQDAGHRIRTRLWLKTFGIPAFIAVFFVAYFLLLHCDLFAVTFMPETALDRWIGFHPWAIMLYFSLWIYVSLPPTLSDGLHSLLHYMYAAIGLSLAAMLVFLFWPTATPAFNIDWSRYPSFDFLKSVDLARNAFPSLHVAFAVLSGLWLSRWLRTARAPVVVRVLNWIWCLGILYSTIATRQHVALDVYSGIVFGIATFAVYWWCSLRKAHAAQSGHTVEDVSGVVTQRLPRE